MPPKDKKKKEAAGAPPKKRGPKLSSNPDKLYKQLGESPMPPKKKKKVLSVKEALGKPRAQVKKEQAAARVRRALEVGSRLLNEGVDTNPSKLSQAMRERAAEKNPKIMNEKWYYDNTATTRYPDKDKKKKK